MTQIVRRFSWLTRVLQADPEHARDKRYVIEYEFSSPGGREPTPASDDARRFRFHDTRSREPLYENGQRVFRGNYDQRGPYTPEE